MSSKTNTALRLASQCATYSHIKGIPPEVRNLLKKLKQEFKTSEEHEKEIGRKVPLKTIEKALGVIPLTERETFRNELGEIVTATIISWTNPSFSGKEPTLYQLSRIQNGYADKQEENRN